MAGDRRWRPWRLAASATAGVCVLVLLPIATNIATGGSVPAFLRQGWVSWTAVAVLGLIAVVAYVPAAAHPPEPGSDGPAPDYREVEQDSEIEPEPEPDEDVRDSYAPLYSAPVRLEGLPRQVRGRDGLLARLAECRRQGGLVVLVGAGGMGKSTLARELVRRAAAGGPEQDPAWEVSAATSGSLVDGLRAVGANLTADQREVAAIGAATPESPDHLWRLLDDAEPGWLLIIDNADDLAALGRPGRAGGRPAEQVSDGTGWVRAGRTGLVLVTSRHLNASRWPKSAVLVDVGVLDDDAAAAVLRDLAPRAGGQRAARRLARRLGRLPLALRLAGRYLGSPYAEHTSFDAYRAALESDPRLIRAIELNPDDPEAVERMVLMRTWELSLDALAARGMPQARPTLRLLSCFAPGESVPLALLRGRLDAFLAASVPGAAPSALRQVLEGLDNLGLILATKGTTEHGMTGPGVKVHAVVADTNRLHLIEEGPAGTPEELIRTTAVTLIAAELEGLTAARPSAWAKFRLLTPHLQALLSDSAPRLADAALVTLAATTGSVAPAYGYLDRAELGITLLRSLLGARRAWAGDLAETRLLALQDLAHLLMSSRPKEAERIFREVLTVRLRDWPADSPVVLAARHNILEARLRQVPWEKVRPAYESLLAHERRALGAEFSVTLETRQTVALQVGIGGDWPAAAELLSAVANDAGRVYGEKSSTALTARHNHVEVLRRLSQSAAVNAEARRLRHDVRETLGEDHVVTRQLIGANEFLATAMVSSPDLHVELAQVMFKKGNDMDRNELEPALEAFDELIARFGADPTPRIVEIVAQGMFQKANLLLDAGRWRESAAVYDDLIGRYDGEDSAALRKIVAPAFHNKAIAAVWDPDQRVDAAQQALDRYRRLAEDDPDTFADRLTKDQEYLEQVRATAPPTMLRYAAEAARAGRRAEALDVLEKLITRYDQEPAQPLRQLVAEAMLQRAVLLARPDDEQPAA